MFRRIITYHFENNREPTSAVCGQNTGLYVPMCCSGILNFINNILNNSGTQGNVYVTLSCTIIENIINTLVTVKRRVS